MTKIQVKDSAATAVAEKKEGQALVDVVMEKLTSRQLKDGLQFPANYSVTNAVMSAQLILSETKDKDNNPVLSTCTKSSIVNAVMEMATQGLNPAKQQCYFIAYGNKLVMQRSYLGTIAMTKRLKGVSDVVAYPVYETDVFKIGFNLTTGKTEIKEFEPSLEHDPSKIKGAFALVIGEKGILHVEWMTIEEIKAAWNMGQTNGSSKAHKNFTGEMCKKTVINRACKLYAKTSDDESLLATMIASEPSREDIEFEMTHQEEQSADAEFIDVDADADVKTPEEPAESAREAEAEDSENGELPYTEVDF